jgi:hypothetical protein
MLALSEKIVRRSARLIAATIAVRPNATGEAERYAYSLECDARVAADSGQLPRAKALNLEAARVHRAVRKALCDRGVIVLDRCSTAALLRALGPACEPPMSRAEQLAAFNRYVARIHELRGAAQ